MRPTRTVGTAMAWALAFSLGVTACSDEPEPDSPEGAARLIADGISRGDLAQAPVAGSNVNASLRKVTALMKGKPTVSVVSLEPGDTDTKRSARLRHAWKVGDRRWTYEARITLARAGDRWQTPWQPSIVHPKLRSDEQLVARSIPQERADILSVSGEPLVTSRPVFRIGIDRSTLKGDASTAATALAKVLDLDAGAYAAQVKASGPKAFLCASPRHAGGAGDATGEGRH